MSNGGNGGYRSGNQGYQSQNRGFQQYDQPYGAKRDQSKNGETLRPVNFDNAAAFRKDFYNPSDSARARSADEVKALIAKYEISVTGRDSNKYPPIAYFSEAGFPDYIMNEINRQGFTSPTGIQGGGMPIAMSGRNLVGIAKTGSGKTLAYIIPALVHLKHQQPVQSGDGPIALVLAPTRELAQQIQVRKSETSSSNVLLIQFPNFVGRRKQFRTQEQHQKHLLVRWRPESQSNA